MMMSNVFPRNLIPPVINTSLKMDLSNSRFYDRDDDGDTSGAAMGPANLFFGCSHVQSIKVWVTSIDEIEIGEEMNLFVRSLAPPEREKALRFYYVEDQKRSVISTMLQRAKIREAFQLEEGGYEIRRTSENKPYVVSHCRQIDSWNYNVSHHGKYVCIASHDSFLIGVDIVDITTRTGNISNSYDYVNIFQSQLTKRELHVITSQATEEDRYTMFFIYWSLKESFVKAIGKGLGYNLQDVSNNKNNNNNYNSSRRNKWKWFWSPSPLIHFVFVFLYFRSSLR